MNFEQRMAERIEQVLREHTDDSYYENGKLIPVCSCTFVGQDEDFFAPHVASIAAAGVAEDCRRAANKDHVMTSQDEAMDALDRALR